MRLITAREILNTVPEFKGKTIVSVHSFIKTRNIDYIKKMVPHNNKRGQSYTCFYNYDEIIEWLIKKPIEKRTRNNPPGKKANVKPKKETDDPILGKTQPYRDIDICVNGKDCLNEAAYGGGKINCKDCQRYQKKEFKYYETT